MTALALAFRELRDRSRLFIICAALATVPFIAAALPAARADRAGVIAVVSSFLALALALGSAVALGASTVARDLVERRLSFYFSKPVSPAAIWIGKATASLIASLVCFAIIAAPGALASRRVWPMLWMMTASQLVVIATASVVVLFFLSHTLATMIRSRSPWIAIDFMLAVIAVGAVALLVRPLLAGAAVELARTTGLAVGAAVLIVLAVAPIGQLARGRTDIRRSHAALSRSLWPPLVAVLALVAAYEWWVVSVTPSDLEAILYLEQPPAGGRAYVFGSTRNRGDYHAGFLVEAGGRWRRIPSMPWGQVAFSRDGRTAVWLEQSGFFPSADAEVHTDRGATKITARGFSELVLSDDGSRLAIGYGPLVTVYDLASGRLLVASSAFDGAKQHAMFFASNDVLRIIESDYRRASALKIFELDAARRKLTMTGLATVPTGDAVNASSDGSRLLLRHTRRVIDGRTGATLLQLPPVNRPAGAVLRDGRVIDARFDGKTSSLQVIGGREIPLPAGVATVAGELSDGRILVSGAKRQGWSTTGADRSMFIVDADTGQVLRTLENVKGPQSRWWAADPRLVRFSGTRLAGVDGTGRILWFDAR
jgi:hypothetical protein